MKANLETCFPVKKIMEKSFFFFLMWKSCKLPISVSQSLTLPGFISFGGGLFVWVFLIKKTERTNKEVACLI